MAKGQKFLKVTSILMIIGGALSGITCLLGIAGVALLAAVADSHVAALLLYLALALALAAAVVEFIAGLKGLKACKTGENADKCVILGAVIAGITILSTIINLAGGGKVNVTSILLSLVVPGLYIYGAMQVKKGEWQPQQAQAVPQQPYQQAQAVPQQPYQQAPQYQQTPPQQDQPRRTSERPAFQNPYSQAQQPQQDAPYTAAPQQPVQQVQPEQTAPPPAFCPACGTKTSGESFCQNCGAALR